MRLTASLWCLLWAAGSDAGPARYTAARTAAAVDFGRDVHVGTVMGRMGLFKDVGLKPEDELREGYDSEKHT